MKTPAMFKSVKTNTFWLAKEIVGGMVRCSEQVMGAKPKEIPVPDFEKAIQEGSMIEQPNMSALLQAFKANEGKRKRK